MTVDEAEFERRVEARLAEWQASYATAGTATASPLLDRILAEREVEREMGLTGPPVPCAVCDKPLRPEDGYVMSHPWQPGPIYVHVDCAGDEGRAVLLRKFGRTT